MKCDGAGRPDELAAVCQERDALAARVAQLEAEKAVLIDFAKKSCEACEVCRHVDIFASEKCEGICYGRALASCPAHNNCLQCGVEWLSQPFDENVWPGPKEV